MKKIEAVIKPFKLDDVREALSGIGITGMTAHYTLARAMQLADVSVILPIDFLRVPLAALVGYALYSEALDIWVISGGAIVFLSNYNLVWRESRAPATEGAA